ncbi:CIA30 family protein [Roseinatronobacter sp. S2]|uniref:CIA30 family protein n=1 Tax=Roseinatronobacter sp. S2 TaxID=3035471 RepID=UPI0024103483|nr:CIA30 family protein [Roseinatronobacter sp. S2]WFE76402.1 CIA30 family protein [Roseinatronobacter sp. S2]
MNALIDDLTAPHPSAANGAVWEVISDRVMGGMSQGTMTREEVRGRPALRMQGNVSLENNGGFVQIALDLGPHGGAIDASQWSGLELDVTGNSEAYNLHLRTADIVRPWQSYRTSFCTVPEWRTIRLPFTDFTAHRIDAPLDLSRLRRIGIVAIGRSFAADIAIGGIRFFA